MCSKLQRNLKRSCQFHVDLVKYAMALYQKIYVTRSTNYMESFIIVSKSLSAKLLHYATLLTWETLYSCRSITCKVKQALYRNFGLSNSPLVGQFLRSNWIISPTIPPCILRRGLIGGLLHGHELLCSVNCIQVLLF